MTNSLRRIVIDTNVYLSAALSDMSTARQALNHVLAEDMLLMSPATFAELVEVLHRSKFKKYLEAKDIAIFLDSILRVAQQVEVTLTIQDCRDPKDNKFLELAVSGEATIIISGDADLQEMHPYRGIAIVSPRAFVDGL